MSGINIPVDSSHLSDQDHAEMIEQYTGAVDSQFAKDSIMRRFIQVRSVRGTDTIINRRVGKTALQKLVPGVRPAASKTPFGRVSLTIDTVVLARDNRSMLNEFQIDFDARAELGKDHGKQLAKFTDEAFFIQAIKAANSAAPSGLNGAIGAGKVETLLNAGDELDPDLLADAITRILVRMEEEDIPIEESRVFVRPTAYTTLTNHDKLVDGEFSPGNGDYSKNKVKMIHGVPIFSTARIPTAAINGHFLSNEENSYAYDINATEAKAVAIVLHPQSLLAGETIPMTTDVFFSKEEKQWFIDAYTAFGISTRRPDVSGAVFKA